MSKKHFGREPEDDDWKNCLVHRVSDFTEKWMIMSMGWCLLFWGKWLYWEYTRNKGVGTGSIMTAELVQVMLFSLLSFISIRFIDKIADKLVRGSETEIALRRTIKMFGLLMGLSWESTFTSAVEAIGSDLEGKNRILFDAAVTSLICLAVLPAWAWYILPKTIEMERGVTSVSLQQYAREWSILTDYGQGPETGKVT